MIKKILSFLTVCIPLIAFGQNPVHPLLNVTTPQAEAIGIYGQIPVDYSTGIPNTQIPLYDIELDNVKLPIVCRYHLAGVKPNVPSGVMGLGWSLSSGGCISRTVSHIPDEVKFIGSKTVKGYFEHASEVASINNAEDLAQVYENFSAQNDSVYELSADEFSFSFCGYSGNFYYGSDKKWHVRSDQNVIVEFNPDSDFITNQQLVDSRNMDQSYWKYDSHNTRYFNKFRIIAPDGTKYYFGGVTATEYSIDYYSRDASYLIPTSWYLTKIVTTKGHEITLDYTVGSPNCQLRYDPFRVNDPSLADYPYLQTDCSQGHKTYGGFLLFPVYLESITTPNSKITYSYDIDNTYKNRLLPTQIYPRVVDFRDPYKHVAYNSSFFKLLDVNYADDVPYTDIKNLLEWKSLKSISVFGSSNYKYKFTYDYGSVKKLVAVDKCPLAILGGSDDSIMRYSFDYYTNPRTTSGSFYTRALSNTTDYWGYWNSSTERLSITEQIKEIFEPNISDFTCCNAETLKEITYPTGGKVRFDYELNDFEFAVSKDRQALVEPSIEYIKEEPNSSYDKMVFVKYEARISHGAGLRIKRITRYDDNQQEVKEFQYKNTDGESSGILNALPCLYDVDKLEDDIVHRQAKSGFRASNTNHNAALVNYSRVTVSTKINGISNGHEVYTYSDYRDFMDQPADYYYLKMPEDDAPVPTTSLASARGKLLKKEVYSSKNLLLQTEEYQYEPNPNNGNSITTISQRELVHDFKYIYKAALYRTNLDSYFPSRKVIKTYSTDGSNRYVANQTIYSYNSHKQLCAETYMGLDNVPLYTTEYLYPQDVLEAYSFVPGINKKYDAYKALYDQNIINSPIATTTVKSGKVINSKVGIYSLVNNKPVLTEEYELKEQVESTGFLPILFTSEYDETPVNEMLKKTYSYGEFDQYNNPCFIWTQNKQTLLLWGDKGQYVIGKIENADLHTIKNVLSFPIADSNRSFVNLEKYRKLLPNAHISTYEYLPSVGLDYSVDERGIDSGYKYDKYGRLVFAARTYGHDWKVNNVIDYNYKHK